MGGQTHSQVVRPNRYKPAEYHPWLWLICAKLISDGTLLLEATKNVIEWMRLALLFDSLWLSWSHPSLVSPQSYDPEQPFRNTDTLRPEAEIKHSFCLFIKRDGWKKRSGVWLEALKKHWEKWSTLAWNSLWFSRLPVLANKNTNQIQSQQEDVASKTDRGKQGVEDGGRGGRDWGE